MLQEEILFKSAKIGIVGLGYVGLPFSFLCVEKGFEVIGFEINEKKINALKDGASYISEISDKQVKLIMDTKRFNLSNNFCILSVCDIILVCVPTPLAANGNPNYSYLFDSLEAIANTLRKGQLIIIESTLVPETTNKEIIPILCKSGLEIGEDFYLAYSPERIDPGNHIYQLQNIPKLVSGYSNKCAALAELFYSQLSIEVFTVSSMAVAELSKILENTYRDINIALINEMAQICYAHKINIWEVIDAASSKPFGFHPFYPGPGVGGHCIPKDSEFYSNWAKKVGKTATLCECARRINNTMPNYIITRLAELLANDKKDINGSQILVLGVTYKPDVNDLRESPTIKILELLLSMGAHLSIHDPYINQINVNNQLIESVDFNSIKNNKYDCIILAVAHSFYKDYKEFNASNIFDLTNTVDKTVRNLTVI